MRLVVDTNVFVSAALKESSWPAFVVRWLSANGRLLKTLQAE
jgi:predicted nucleic acid-binding protein